MTDIVDSRQNLSVEETDFKSPLSEAFYFKMGASMNFINNKQVDKHAWHLNGPYKLGEGSTGVDGVFPCLYNMEITGLHFGWEGGSGLTGATTVDIHWFSGNVDQGSIFSTRPSIANTASNNTHSIFEIDPDTLGVTNVQLSTGHTAPVITKAQFAAGNVLRFDLDTATSGAENFQLTIFFRPRN